MTKATYKWKGLSGFWLLRDKTLSWQQATPQLCAVFDAGKSPHYARVTDYCHSDKMLDGSNLEEDLSHGFRERVQHGGKGMVAGVA